MNLSARLSSVAKEILADGCPAIRDPWLARPCRRKRYARRRCFACVEMPGKTLERVRDHALKYGKSLIGAYLEQARLAGG
ncbi:MAG: hypothetical protein ACYS9X_30685, partial [Planctomycetota bacterium]